MKHTNRTIGLSDYRKMLRLTPLFALALAFFGCAGANNVKNSVLPATTGMSQTYRSFLDLQTDYAGRLVDTVDRYGVLPEEAKARSAAGLPVDLDAIGDYLPDDLSTLTRPVVNARGAVVGETNMQADLDRMVEEFRTDLAEVAPDTAAAETLDYVEAHEDGIVIGGDMVVPSDSMEGAVQIEYLNAVANGADPEELLRSFEAETESYLGGMEGDGTEARAVYTAHLRPWRDGEVIYRWRTGKNAITDLHKEATLEAMRTWEDKTGDVVSFTEMNDTGWKNAMVNLLMSRCLTIGTKQLGDFTNGEAMVGQWSGWLSYMNLDTELGNDPKKSSLDDESALQRTPLHELGHVLGLKHEHQRHDRDNYLKIDSDKLKDGTNYGKIPEYNSWISWRWRYVRIFWTKIRIGYPVFGRSRHSHTVGSFDFDSIMLYSDFEKKDGKMTLWNTTLSANDIKAVQQIYE